MLGSQWGDEGKGKLVDILAADIDVCARCAGGNNAGHTIVVPMGEERVMKTFAFHLIPSGKKKLLVSPLLADRIFMVGLVNPKCAGIIGSGVVVHIPSFFKELEGLEAQGQFIFSQTVGRL